MLLQFFLIGGLVSVRALFQPLGLQFAFHHPNHFVHAEFDHRKVAVNRLQMGKEFRLPQTHFDLIQSLETRTKMGQQ